MVLFRNDKYENEKELIFIDSTNEYPSLNYYILENKIDKNNKQFSFNLVSNNDLNFFLNNYGPDSMFMRVSTHCTDFGFNSTYLLDINEKYYLYIKKLYGNVDIYQYKKKLNKNSDISKLNK